MIVAIAMSTARRKSWSAARLTLRPRLLLDREQLHHVRVHVSIRRTVPNGDDGRLARLKTELAEGNESLREGRRDALVDGHSLLSGGALDRNGCICRAVLVLAVIHANFVLA